MPSYTLTCSLTQPVWEVDKWAAVHQYNMPCTVFGILKYQKQNFII